MVHATEGKSLLYYHHTDVHLHHQQHSMMNRVYSLHSKVCRLGAQRVTLQAVWCDFKLVLVPKQQLARASMYVGCCRIIWFFHSIILLIHSVLKELSKFL